MSFTHVGRIFFLQIFIAFENTILTSSPYVYLIFPNIENHIMSIVVLILVVRINEFQIKYSMV